MKNYITIVTSTNSRKDSLRIKDSILSKKLSPCIQIMKNVESSYIWKGKILTEYEELIYIKTSDCKKNQIIKEINSIHSYDTPEIICYNFDIVSDKYEKWFLGNIGEE